ncbi:hypothetical protein FA95DRAFT_1559719 [Auriscalpium vulgare]|uniref:Uncharacterized protein n=1 Tax=Auriscalpium vulgare TaxID=40419 RepID=A0ACB8RRR1_9AGAM|nr:hypothetical protein FA95DRAFT_1559719 [Auriscalpium vulgare]
MVKSTRKQLRFAFSMDWVDHYNNTRLAALTRQARTAVCELPTEHLEQLLFYADTFRRGGSFFMDTNKLDLAFIEYAKAVILLHEVLPGRSDFVTKLNDTQRTNIALVSTGVNKH